MKVVAVIPARYKSSRFEGKPLADVHGKPMVYRVYKQVEQVKEINEVYIATDDVRIAEVCILFGLKYIMTSAEHPTGMDRVAEVATKIPADLYVNVQGDEPLLEPQTIAQAILPFQEDDSLAVSNLMAKIQNPVDLLNSNIPKVVTNCAQYALYLTRSPAPYPKTCLQYDFFKQVCVYGVRPDVLMKFASWKRGRLEEIEDIEILRFLENGVSVKFFKVETESIAVDTCEDLQRVLRSSSCLAE